MDPAELLKPINDRPIAAVRMGPPLWPVEWQGLIAWLQNNGRRVVLIDHRGALAVSCDHDKRHMHLFDATWPVIATTDLDLRGKMSDDEIAGLLFWCCLCVAPEGAILDMAREKAVPAIVAEKDLTTALSRIEALWKRQDEEARALADV